jgi:transcriptional regulator with XRE-family HTH domain
VVDEPSPGFAAKVDRLFKTIRTPQGKEYTPEHVAEWLRANGGPSVSASYLYSLRRGSRSNPTKAQMEALARFFGVPPAYFFDEEHGQRMSEELELLAALRDADVREVALRTSELHGDARRSVAAIVREMGWARRTRAREREAGERSGEDADS